MKMVAPACGVRGVGRAANWRRRRFFIRQTAGGGIVPFSTVDEKGTTVKTVAYCSRREAMKM